MFLGGDPFEHFASSGGMPGGGSRRGPSRDVDTTKLYEALGVSFNICVVIFFMLLILCGVAIQVVVDVSIIIEKKDMIDILI